MRLKSVTSLLFCISLVIADTAIPSTLFHLDPLGAAAQIAPLWHFDSKTCFPSTATTADGSQTPSCKADFCGLWNGGLSAGCPVQSANFIGARTDEDKKREAVSFPTYVTAEYCEGDGSWRVVFNVFFVKDTGHPYDWEWAAIRLLPDEYGNYHRHGLWMEQDGEHPYTPWSNIPNTFDNESDMSEGSNAGRDHPKAYFGKWKHSVALNIGGGFANDCPGAIIEKKDYHSDDFMFHSSKNLVRDSLVPAKYDYGAADSTPMSFRKGGRYDICGNTFALASNTRSQIEL